MIHLITSIHYFTSNQLNVNPFNAGDCVGFQKSSDNRVGVLQSVAVGRTMPSTYCPVLYRRVGRLVRVHKSVGLSNYIICGICSFEFCSVVHDVCRLDLVKYGCVCCRFILKYLLVVHVHDTVMLHPCFLLGF